MYRPATRTLLHNGLASTPEDGNRLDPKLRSRTPPRTFVARGCTGVDS